MKTLTLTDKEAEMFDELLDYAGDLMSNQGCNDLDLSKFGFTVEDMRGLAREYHCQNGDPEEAEPERTSDAQLRDSLPDFCALQLLQWRIKPRRRPGT